MTECELVAALDSGTQSCRCFLFDINMHPVASHQEPVTQIYPQPGWLEHDPSEIAELAKVCMAKALSLAESKLGSKVKVVSIGITNQRETCVVWSRSTGLPLYNAIVWSDGRTSEICARMARELGGKDYFRSITGLPISTYFSAFKFKWLFEDIPEVKVAVESGDALFGTIDSWIIYELTGGVDGGVHLTDVTNASRTNLMSLETLDWHDSFLPLFHLSRSALPRIISNSEHFGNIAAHRPMSGVSISGCLGDQQSALLGQRCIEGEAKNTYGTGCFLLLNTGLNAVPSSHGLLTTVAYKLGKREACFALEGSVAVGGMGFSWLKDNLQIINTPDEARILAASVENTAGVYFVPAFSGLLAPRWIDSARGVIVGLTLAANKAHICRAMHEAIAFQSLEVLNAMVKDSGIKLRVLRVDGGAAKNDLLMQMQASLAQTDVIVPHFKETTALGAALAAGLASGFWSESQVFSHSYSYTTFHPKMSREDADRRLTSWEKAVAISLNLASLES